MNFLFPYMARWKAVNWSRYHQIFTQLALLGHNVHVIQAPIINSRETNFQEIDTELPPKLYLHDVAVNSFIWNSTLPLNKLVKKGYYCLKSYKKVQEIINEHKIDVLFLYNIPQYPLLKVKSCFKVFDFADDYLAMLQHELGRFNNGLTRALGVYLLDEMIDKSDITLAVSEVLADSIKDKYREKIKVIPNGVNLNDVTTNCGSQVRVRYKKPIIGFIGSFEYFIDFDLILNVAEELKQFTFLLVGSGRNYAYVENKVKERNLTNVYLTGGVPHCEIAWYIDAMDICLNVFKKMPTSHSACPIKLFEYMSFKKPVISTRLKEVEKIDDGFLFYADTVDEMLGEIQKILTDKALVKKHVDKGYDLLKVKYQWNIVVTNFLDAIEAEIRITK